MRNPLLRSLILWYSQNEWMFNESNNSSDDHKKNDNKTNNNNYHNYSYNDNNGKVNNSIVNHFYKDQNNSNNLFIPSFIDTIATNIIKSKQGQRYNDTVKKFAMLLFTLGGKSAYQFVRMNIVGALPSLTILSTFMSTTDCMITEGQFRFNALKKYTDSVHTKYGFCSEDFHRSY